MNASAIGWTLLGVAMASALGLLGTEIAALSSWSEATTPAFVGKSFVHLGTVMAAFWGGKQMPTS